MTILKTLTIVAALLASGTSLAMAQNGLPTGGQTPVAGGANGGGWAGRVVLRSTATGTCMPTIRITAT